MNDNKKVARSEFYTYGRVLLLLGAMVCGILNSLIFWLEPQSLFVQVIEWFMVAVLVIAVSFIAIACMFVLIHMSAVVLAGLRHGLYDDKRKNNEKYWEARNVK